jgi:hypothetical protein
MYRLLAIVGALLTLTACVTQKMESSFDPSAAAFIHTKGIGTISGQAFLRRNDGIVIYAAGSDVFLMPSTQYTDERTSKYFRGMKFTAFDTRFESDDPRFKEFTRSTKADGEGRFVFNNVAPGIYHVVTSVFWMVGYNRQGGAMIETVSVDHGASVNVVMSGQ